MALRRGTRFTKDRSNNHLKRFGAGTDVAHVNIQPTLSDIKGRHGEAVVQTVSSQKHG